VRIAAVHDQLGLVESGGKELLVAFEFQLVRHQASGVRQHSFRGHDHVTIDTQTRHPAP